MRRDLNEEKWLTFSFNSDFAVQSTSFLFFVVVLFILILAIIPISVNPHGNF